MSGELKAFFPWNITLIRKRVSELISMFIAKPMAKLFALRKLTNTEYRSDISIEATTPAMIP
jgi:hypothetical protein